MDNRNESGYQYQSVGSGNKSIKDYEPKDSKVNIDLEMNNGTLVFNDRKEKDHKELVRI